MWRFIAIGFAIITFFQAENAAAKSWVVDYDHSRLGFTGMQSHTAFDGSFKKYTVTIDFDPDHPETGKITATIDMTSAVTGDATRDGALSGPDWFGTKKFPDAQFVSTHIDRTGTSSYEAQGALTIKGVTKPVVLPFTLRPDGDHWRAEGKAALIRNEFNIGQGEWAGQDVVAWAVDVTIDVAAKPAP